MFTNTATIQVTQHKTYPKILTLSSNEKIFNDAIPEYQDAIEKAGYKYKLYYDPQIYSNIGHEAPKKKT